MDCHDENGLPITDEARRPKTNSIYPETRTGSNAIGFSIMIPLSKLKPNTLFGSVFVLLSLIAAVGNLATPKLVTLWIGNRNLRFIGSALFGFVLAQSSLIGLWLALALVLFLVRATGYRLEKASMLMSPAKRFSVGQ